MVALPKRVRVELGRSTCDTTIKDAETGEDIPGVVALRVDIDSRRGQFATVDVTRYAEGLVIEGEAREGQIDTALVTARLALLMADEVGDKMAATLARIILAQPWVRPEPRA